MKRVAPAAAIVLLAAACGGGDPAARPGATGTPVESATVDATDKLTFEPKVVYLKIGGTVTWKNDGALPHTVTFTGFDKPLKAGQQVQFTFASGGRTLIRCTLHPQMTGEIYTG